MTEARPTFATTLERLGMRLAADLSEIRAMIEHAPSKGSALEAAVAEAIGRYLPDHFLVTSGFATNASGELSPQQDVLVVLNDRIGPLASYGGFGIYPIENIFAAIEVKTRLTVVELRSALESLGRFRRMAPNEPGHNPLISDRPGNALGAEVPICAPFTGVFALSADVAPGRILDECRESHGSAGIRERLNAVHVLGHSLTCWVDWAVAGLPALMVDPQAKNPLDWRGFDWDGRDLVLATTESDGRQGLQAFFALLLGFVNWYTPPRLDLGPRLLEGVRLPFNVESKPPSGPNASVDR